MSHRSKREIAPQTHQALPPGVPWWGGAVNPGVAFPPSGESMAVPGWWTTPPLQSNSFVPPYGAWMGAATTPDGQGNQNTSNDPLERNAESTTLECLEYFVQGVIEVFGAKYLRRPTVEDTERLLQVGESRGFPGNVGSIDCMHWRWENCPTAWKGQYTNGRYGFPTVILEAVASYDLHIWHAFFGVAGSNNDINVLNQSPLFIEAIKGEAPRVQFSVNGNQYNTGYYLADGIYPEWAAFVKSINSPQLEKHKVYARQQEATRKDVERAFGVLQSRFNIVRRPARSWNMKILRKIMTACVILHNMIVEDEGEMAKENIDLNAIPGTSIALPPEVQKATNSNPCFNDIRRRNFAIRCHSTHVQLINDLIEHIWQHYGNRENN